MGEISVTMIPKGVYEPVYELKKMLDVILKDTVTTPQQKVILSINQYKETKIPMLDEHNQQVTTKTINCKGQVNIRKRWNKVVTNDKTFQKNIKCELESTKLKENKKKCIVNNIFKEIQKNRDSLNKNKMTLIEYNDMKVIFKPSLLKLILNNSIDKITFDMLQVLERYEPKKLIKYPDHLKKIEE